MKPEIQLGFVLFFSCLIDLRGRSEFLGVAAEESLPSSVIDNPSRLEAVSRKGKERRFRVNGGSTDRETTPANDRTLGGAGSSLDASAVGET